MLARATVRLSTGLYHHGNRGPLHGQSRNDSAVAKFEVCHTRTHHFQDALIIYKEQILAFASGINATRVAATAGHFHTIRPQTTDSQGRHGTKSDRHGSHQTIVVEICVL
jgi:hypothetical protein